MKPDPLLTQAGSIATDRALLEKGGLYDFVRMAWPIVEPSRFVGNWHLEEVCSHLEAVSRCEILKLIINMPPGTGKSSLVSVFWPAWEWITRPETKWMLASYDASLVGMRDGGKVIRLLQSDWFVQRWGHRILDPKPANAMFWSTGGGFRFATSVGGKATGWHPNIKIVDDPIKPKDAAGGGTQTKTMLRRVSEWWRNTMSSRAADLATNREVVMMQRLNEEDLAGELIAKGGYVHLCLPMRYEIDRHCATPIGGDRRTKNGELLFPDRFPRDAVNTLAEDMGPDTAAAQLQQRPSRKGGGIFKREWFRFYHTAPNVLEPCLCERCWLAKRALPEHTGTRTCPVLPKGGNEFQSWDMTFKGADTSDFVAGLVWRCLSGEAFLIDCVNERLSFTETLASVIAMSTRHPRAIDKLVEDKANGPAVANMLRDRIQGITLVQPMGGKDARANATSPSFAAGKVFLPHPDLAPWVWGYMLQLESFPRAVNDDMVDATTQALIRLRQFGDTFATAMARIRGETK